MIKLLLMSFLIQIGNSEPIDVSETIELRYHPDERRLEFVMDEIFNNGFEQGVTDVKIYTS